MEDCKFKKNCQHFFFGSQNEYACANSTGNRIDPYGRVKYITSCDGKHPVFGKQVQEKNRIHRLKHGGKKIG